MDEQGAGDKNTGGSKQADGANDFIVVGIGASAGGIRALKEFFKAMPPDPDMAFVVVLHLSPSHESSLAAVLQSETSLRVTQVTKTMKVLPNNVYVIPPNRGLIMIDGDIRPTRLENEQGSRTAIDLFFRTLSEAYGRRAICVVLSGTGTDGTLGLKLIKGRNGFAIVQQPEDTEYDGMPRSAIDTKLVDVVLPAREMPAKLIAVRDSSEKFKLIDGEEETVTPKLKNSEALHEILTLLRVRTGHDFSSYKQPTILRRIARHLQIHDLDDISDYVMLLRERPEEVQSLLHNLLINVTNFFRDKGAFDVLAAEIIPRLFVNKGPQDQVRVWVAGCASGEEAYSLAMLLLEQSAVLSDPPKLQIFASDVDDIAIARAREGRYLEAIETDVGHERLQKFFIKEGSYYRVKKQVREIVLFAPHNLLRDPPFSRIDLISCRNVLIYLNRPTQEKLLQIFHFALNSSGYLFLGSSESAEIEPAIFTPVEKKSHVYSPERTANTINVMPPTVPTAVRWDVKLPELQVHPRNLHLSSGELHYRLVEHYAPPSILVNEEFEICHLSQSAGRYLRFRGGEPSLNLLKAVHPDLLPDVRAALFAAKHDSKPPEFQNVQCQIDGKTQLVKLTVRPISIPETGQRFLLVLFDESTPTTAEAVDHPPAQTVAGDDAIEGVVRRMEEELRLTKDRLRSTIEQHETSVEELKASNEELQAINEELRSATEELETGKEELQSVNEELSTVNAELKGKVDEISSANSDLQNLMASTDIGTMFLDRELRIKRYTPRLQSLFNIIPSDIGRPLAHLTHRLQYQSFTEDCQKVLENLSKIEREIQGEEGQTYILRYLPYRTMDDRIDGVVLTLIDVSERIAAAESLRRSEERFRAIVNQATTGVAETSLDGHFTFVNQRFCEITGYSQAELFQRHLQDITHPDDLPYNQKLFKQMVRGGTPFEIEKRYVHKNGKHIWVHDSVTIIRDRDGKPQSAVAVVLEIGRRKQIEGQLRDADRQKDEFLATLSHELRNPLTPIQNGLTIIRRSLDNKEVIQKFLPIMERQMQHIVHLVDDLLDVSRISHGKISLKRIVFKLSSAIELALDTVRQTIEERHLQLHMQLPDEPIELFMDLSRIAQVIANLLNNAVKYNRPEGQIWIEVERLSNEVAVRVRDSGIGISATMLPKIFDLSIQSDTEGQTGLGIGLNLVKTLVEMHGGRVEARSAGRDQGAEFLVYLPLHGDREKAVGARPAAKGTTAFKMHRILVVDDNRDTADTLAVLLEGAGHVMRTSYDGKSALTAAAEFKPDVAVLDIGMPEMNGRELARHLKEMLPDSLLIAVSGWGQQHDRDLSAAAGFAHHLVKPVHIEDLVELIH